MKLAGAVTQGSGSINEDGWGFLGKSENVSAAWIFDGVTGINGKNFLGGTTDAAWFVAKAHAHLLQLAGLDLPLPEILARLVKLLIRDFQTAAEGLDIPKDFDPPAACLILVKRYGETWKALRLGDSCLLARDGDGAHTIHSASPNNILDNWLSTEAAKRRDAGVLDIKLLVAEFRPQLLKGRKLRNTQGAYSILEAREAATEFAEYLDLICKTMAEGQESGAFRKDLKPVVCAKILYGALDEMVTNWILSKKSYPLAPMAGEVLKIFFGGVLQR